MRKLISALLMLSCFMLNAKNLSYICLKGGETSRELEYSAKELQKYIYLRTGLFVPIDETGTRIKAHSFVLCKDSDNLEAEEYSIEGNDDILYIKGGSDIAVLYGVYSYAEYLGVRFSLHGDIIPEEKFDGPLFGCSEKNVRPLFSKRGLLPFHDFPEGPDLWDEDAYKACITQMVKMKLNFFSLHNYPNVEPNVWVGLAEDVLPNGNVRYSYPVSLANTITSSSWGYSAMDTRDYSCGASKLFTDSVLTSPVIQGIPTWPKDPEQMNTIFNRNGKLFNNVFSLGKGLGVEFCIGVESPLSIPGRVRERLSEKGIDPDSDEARMKLYEGIFTRIKNAHPIDYFWLWTPENWTWGTPSEESIKATVKDVNIARKALEKVMPSCGFGLSGWVIGPPNDKCLFDRVLPKGDFMGSLSRLCGQERLDLGYYKVDSSRFTFPILWMEDDPALTTPQFWVGRIRCDLAESLNANCDGINANFWRTSSIAPNLMAYAQGCWNQSEWNPYYGKKHEYVPAETSDLRIGGVGTSYGRRIKGTEYQYLINTQRYNLKGYRINIPNGTYKITFLFSETKYDEKGKRVFDISVEGRKLLSDIDIYGLVGRDTLCCITTPEFRVDDFLLNIDFTPKKGETFLSAFIIEGETDDVNQIKGEHYKRSIDVGGGLYMDFEADLNEFESNTPDEPRDLPCLSFYQDYCKAMFGEEVYEDAARIFASVDGTVGSEGFRNFRMPRPAAWITGPGVINPNSNAWSEESSKYAFVDSLELLRGKVSGGQNKERFDYWLNTFKYLRAMGHLGCVRGELDRLMKNVHEMDPESAKRFAEDSIVPVRIQMSRLWEEMMGYIISTVQSTGELGTVINLESQTRKTNAFLTRYDKAIEGIIGHELPAEVELSKEYANSPRMFVMNGRGMVEKGEDYTLKLRVLGSDHLTSAPTLCYRELGGGKIRKLRMNRISDNYFEVEMPDLSPKTIEYYVEAGFDGRKVRYPASAPSVGNTLTYY